MRETNEKAGHEEFKHKGRELDGIFIGIGHGALDTEATEDTGNTTWTKRAIYCP